MEFWRKQGLVAGIWAVFGDCFGLLSMVFKMLQYKKPIKLK